MHFKVHQSRARRFHARHWFLLLSSRPFPGWTRAATLATADPSRTRTACARCPPPRYPRSTRGWRRKKLQRKTRLQLQPQPTLHHSTSLLKVKKIVNLIRTLYVSILHHVIAIGLFKLSLRNYGQKSLAPVHQNSMVYAIFNMWKHDKLFEGVFAQLLNSVCATCRAWILIFDSNEEW